MAGMSTRAKPSSPGPALAAGAIVWLAFVLRLWGLDAPSLWLDEAQLLARSVESWRTAILGRTPADLGAPLYPLLLHAWTRLGETDFLVRFPAAVFGTLGVVVLTGLRPRRVGLLASLVYAVAPTQLYYAQEVTYYALVGLLAAAALVVTTRLLEDPPGGPGVARLDLWLALPALAVLSAYTYYGLAFLFVGLDLWLLTRLARARLPSSSTLPAARCMPYVLLAHLFVALACLPLLPLWQRQAERGLEAWWGRYGMLDGWQSLVLFADSAAHTGVVFAVLPFNRPPTWLAWGLLALVAWGAVRRPAWFLAGVLLPFALAFLAARLGRYPFGERYLLFSAPAVYALLAAGLVPHGRVVWQRLAAAVLAPGLIILLLTAWPLFSLPVSWAVRIPREDTRPILAHIQTARRPDDAVYVFYGASPAVAHYQRLGLAPADAVLEDGWPAERIEYQASHALAAGAGHRRLWMVIAHARQGEEDALAQALRRRGAYLVERVTAPGAVGLLWELAS